MTINKDKCEVKEGCNRPVAYTLIEKKSNKELNLCEDHFRQGMGAWLEPDPIIRELKHRGII